MIYQWKELARVPVNAQAAGEEIERIRTRQNGRLEPQDLVAASREPTAPLHPVFEWNDAVAAEAYRIDQARYVIRSLVVQIGTNPDAPPVRAFVSVVRGTDHSYTSTAHALADPDLRQQVLERALAELQSWRRRYSEMVELAQVFAQIDLYSEGTDGENAAAS